MVIHYLIVDVLNYRNNHNKKMLYINFLQTTSD